MQSQVEEEKVSALRHWSVFCWVASTTEAAVGDSYIPFNLYLYIGPKNTWYVSPNQTVRHSWDDNISSSLARWSVTRERQVA